MPYHRALVLIVSQLVALSCGKEVSDSRETKVVDSIEKVLNPEDKDATASTYSGEAAAKYISTEGAKNKNPSSQVEAKIPKLDPEQRKDLLPYLKDDGTLTQGVRVTGVFRFSCLEESLSENRNWLTSGIDLKSIDPEVDVMLNEYVHQAVTSEEMKIADFEDVIAKEDCLVIADIETKESLLGSVSLSKDKKWQNLLDYDATVRSAFQVQTELAGSSRIRIGVIDSGIATDSQEFLGAMADLRLTNVLHGHNRPEDKIGHGTQTASIIASRSYGIAHEHVELVPLLVTDDGKVNLRTLARAIVVGVNLGVEVMNISLSGDSYGCSPVIGHLIFRAIEKGVFFSFSAGNGLRHVPEHKVGYPIVAARDDGPLNFQRTQMPACWGKYFLGAMSVAAIKEDLHLPLFSNYGDDVEIAAPGYNVPVIGLGDKKETMTGTSPASAYVAAAAALAIHHHKAHGFSYTPWYIENLIVESARKFPSLKSRERRTRFGSLLSFAGLQQLLKLTESMSHDQRQSIPTINPRYGEGWLPGRASNLDRLELTSKSDEYFPSDKIRLDGVVFYNHNDNELNSTENDNSYWKVSLASEEIFEGVGTSSPYIEIHKGEIQLDPQKMAQLRQKIATFQEIPVDKVKKIDFVALHVYDEKQHQLYNVYPFHVTFRKEVRVLSRDLEIEPQESKFRFGQTDNRFDLVLTEVIETADGKVTVTTNVTGAAEWLSSKPAEFSPTLVAGVFDATQALIGGSYTVSARFEDLPVATHTISIEDEPVKSYRIHNHLGNIGPVIPGQLVTLDANLVLHERDQAIASDWQLNGSAFASGKSRITLDTGALNLLEGTHTIRARAQLRRADGTQDLTAEYELIVRDDLERIEIHLKQPIVLEGGELLLNVRAYRQNNSYVIVTDQIQWQSSHPDLVSLQSSGKATVAEQSGGTKVRMTARYKGMEHTRSFVIVSGSAVTGSQSELLDIVATIDVRPDRFTCEFARVVDVAAIYADGMRREISSFSSNSNELFHDGQLVPQPVHTRDHSDFFGGDRVEVSLAYNDGSQASGGGGHLIKSLDYNLGISETGLPWLNEPHLIHFQHRPLREQVRWPPCSYNHSIVTSQSFSGSTTLGTSTPGDHTVTLEWDYNGTGEKVRHSLELPFQVTADTPSHLIANREGDRSVTVEQESVNPWPLSFRTPFFLRTQGQRTMRYLRDNYQKSDFSVSSSQGNAVTMDHAIHRDHVEAEICVDPIQHASYQVTLSHSQTSSSASKSFTFATHPLKQVDHTAITEDVVSIREIPPSTKASNFCTPANRALSFAGGSGDGDDPFRICTAAQLMHLNDLPKDRSYSVRIDDHIDFQGGVLSPIAVTISDVDGQGFEVRNFTIVDAEKNRAGLFENVSRVRDLGIRGAVVKGGERVGALCGSCGTLIRTYVAESTITGNRLVGGLAGSAAYIVESANDRSPVSVYVSRAGGLVGQGKGVYRSFSSGSISQIGVPRTQGDIGGLAGMISYGIVVNSRASGNVLAYGSAIGGLIGKTTGSPVLYSHASGMVVSNGASVGGLIGEVQNQSVFGLPTVFATEEVAHFGAVPSLTEKGLSAVIGSKASGNVWGGMSPKHLKCLEGIKEVLGRFGDVECDGETEEQTGGTSEVGGLVGKGWPYLEENLAEGVVKGVNSTGGIIGVTGFVEMYNNRFTGKVSVSDPNGGVGKIVGDLWAPTCKRFPLASTLSYMNGNTWLDNQPEVKWEVGRYRNFDVWDRHQNLGTSQ